LNNIEKRINELESKNAFQEDSIERLSNELRKQQLEIVLLKEKLESFKNQIDADNIENNSIEKPPHY
jgi:uncharacterized coiled-coil protein SlyX|tara:strand:- start:5 stop:205 length:201 start_codon:yes stop_codon:yes gene_type:complete